MQNTTGLIDVTLVQQLIAAQFPEWKTLEVKPVVPGGWDNRTFRLGDNLSVRLPSAADYASQVEKEHAWLPRLSPQLTLPIPAPLAKGTPAFGYPWNWSVYRWLEGEPASVERIEDLEAFAQAIARFLAELRGADSLGAPAAGAHNFHRGGELCVYDQETRAAIARLGGRIDGVAATAMWESALASTWNDPKVWVHGDMSRGNLLSKDGKLHAVIDFGCAAVGDPACDLVIAWTLFEGSSRRMFRSEVGLDPATWARARGWALWKALITLATPQASSPSKNEALLVVQKLMDDPH